MDNMHQHFLIFRFGGVGDSAVLVVCRIIEMGQCPYIDDGDRPRHIVLTDAGVNYVGMLLLCIMVLTLEGKRSLRRGRRGHHILCRSHYHAAQYSVMGVKAPPSSYREACMTPLSFPRCS